MAEGTGGRGDPLTSTKSKAKKRTLIRNIFKWFMPVESTTENDQDGVPTTAEQGAIEDGVLLENDPAVQSQPGSYAVADDGAAQRTDPSEEPLSSTGSLNKYSSLQRGTAPVSAFPDLLSQWSEEQLFQVTKFYNARLKQAIEEGVEGLSWELRYQEHFTGGEHESIKVLAQNGNRMESSSRFLTLVAGKGSRARRAMWESFVRKRTDLPKLDKILKDIQELGSDLRRYMDVSRSIHELSSELEDVEQTHKEAIRTHTETLRVKTILVKEKEKVFQLVDIYAELTVISTVRDRRLVEHELLARGRDHAEGREKYLREELERIQTDEFFQRCFSRRKPMPGCSTAVVGIAGIGKTTMVQKILHGWATGKIYQQFQFVFSFKFQELNSINGRINLKQLILDQYPYLGNILGEIWKNPEGLLFIFDGLDEYKYKIDFADSRRDTQPQCPDPEWWCDVSDIVYNLIQHKLLPGCSVLVTTRPTALRALEEADFSVWTEIMGFSAEDGKEYFNKFFEDRTVAAAVLKHVQENEALSIMSYNPSYCWILALALGPFFTQRVSDPQRVPKTFTQLYAYYIYNILKNHGRETESPRDVLLRAGQMAFRGVSQKKILFSDEDLMKNRMQPSQFLSSFLMELFEINHSARRVVYTFPHISIQEFVAALAQYLNPHPGDILSILTEVHNTTDERFEVFLRFVAGLSFPGSTWGLDEFLGPLSHQTTSRVIDWLMSNVGRETGKGGVKSGKKRLLNTFYCLLESNNTGLAQAVLGSLERLSFRGLEMTPIDCAVLNHAFRFNDTIKHLDLQDCRIHCEALRRLEPGLHKCQELRLGSNRLGDSGVKLLSSVLKNPECKIQKLWLDSNGLTAACAEDLASALSENSSLTELDMSTNELRDAGVTKLSEALKNPDCKIQRLDLLDACLTDSCTENLASALKTNRSLTGLSLEMNLFTDHSVPALQYLINNLPSLEWVQLERNPFSFDAKSRLRSLEDSRSKLKIGLNVNDRNCRLSVLRECLPVGDPRIKPIRTETANGIFGRQCANSWKARHIAPITGRLSSRIRKLRSAATSMAENGNREGNPVTITTTEDVGSSSAISESVDDFKLLQLTIFYRDRLAECLEGAVHDVILALTNETEFSGREIQAITELADKGERAHSSKLLLNLVTEKGCRARRAMWDTFLKMRTGVPNLDEILKEIQQPGFVPSHDLQLARGFSEISSDLTFGDVQRKHREALRAEGEALTVNVFPLRETQKFSQLDDRHAELTVIAAVGDRRLAEHELLAKGREHEVWREKHLRGELGKMRTDQLLQNVFSRSKSKSGSSAAVTGVAGIGKTTMVQRIVHDWATGKVGQQFQFVFYFKFLHLNTINCRINLRELILYQHPYIRNILGEIWKNPEGLLFIFDGLDEFQDITYFANSATGAGTQGRCTDPEMRCKVSDIVYSLVQHKLLPGCSVLVTTRPTTLHFLEKMDICAWAEIIGTVGEEWKEYFYRVFEDKMTAASIFKHVEGNEILYTMTHNPSYCGILAEALGPLFTQGDRDPQRVPKTITQLYSHYIYNILKNHKCETENLRDVLLRVGRMAFAGVSERKIMFTDGDLIEYDLQPFQFPSRFPTELLGIRESAHSATYAFPHLTIQEFVAALAQFLTSCRSDIGNLLTESHCATDGRFDLFLRFCAGLTSPETACTFEEFLGPFPDETARQVIDWVREAHESQLGSAVCHSGKRRLLNILHCLFEAQNRGLADATLGSAEALSFSGLRLTAIDSAVLAHVIGLCDAVNHLDLTGCFMQDEKLQRLGPVLHKCSGLGLGNNAIGDSGMKLVSAALRNSECKIKKLCLNDNGLTQSCAEDLTSALETNRSLVELDLGENRLQDSGVKLLFAALRNPACQIRKLLLRDVDLTASCADELSSALSANRSLTELDLGENRLEDCGVKLLSAALRNTCCKIKKLRLDHNRLTASCAEDLASVLSANYYLKELDLGFNKLGDPGMKFLASALKHPDCKLQALDLWDINLTSCCAGDLASALTANHSLRVLNLGANELGDSAAQLVTEALKGTECKMRDLCLWGAGLTDSCTEHLASALGTVDSLKYLDLGSNGLTDRSVPALHRLIQTSAKLQRIRLRANQLGSSGKRELETLEESRPGLRVTV
ncbi:uncharacterized protein LOC134339917 [Mobula hypostoma]|uniref:uncharacterized protein LOC134339917 n=1 Tax=Mobula hypostoma TaxID=723540 RepID=UPI002FC2F7D9